LSPDGRQVVIDMIADLVLDAVLEDWDRVD
jgi:hypothetical protein